MALFIMIVILIACVVLSINGQKKLQNERESAYQSRLTLPLKSENVELPCIFVYNLYRESYKNNSDTTLKDNIIKELKDIDAISFIDDKGPFVKSNLIHDREQAKRIECKLRERRDVVSFIVHHYEAKRSSSTHDDWLIACNQNYSLRNAILEGREMAKACGLYRSDMPGILDDD